MDWSNVGIQGGIPNRTTVCSTIAAYGTSAAPGSPVTIGNAIAACPAGQVVLLGPGTFYLNGGIDFANKSNVTLRGAGPDKTFLIFTGSSSCWGQNADICVRNGDANWQDNNANTANWTSGYSIGTNQITLSSTANLSPGKMLILDQLDDSSDPGGIYVCQIQGVCGTDIPSGAGRAGRIQEQIVLVTGVSGNTVTISPALYLPNWRASQSPGAWWPSTTITGVGIENLSMDHTNSGTFAGVTFFNAYGCWVKNVRSIDPNRDHVWMRQAARIVVRDSYFYGTQNATQQSYGIEYYMASDGLVENNIFRHITTPIQNNGSSVGMVSSYNYSADDYYTTPPTWQINDQWHHAAGAMMELHEGNEGLGIVTDDIHGTHHFGTFFRNQFSGLDQGKINQTQPIIMQSHSRYYNLIGNVLGTAGYHNQYQSIAPLGTFNNKTIYVLGWSGDGVSGALANDPLTSSTLMRWGNYDVVNGAPQWNSSEVPSGLSSFANPVPASHNLPPSFYLSGRPSWWVTPWGTPPFPAIGPDVTGGTI
ncbi:MAG TPA: hypothetical protein VNB49_08660, partial [Candidatus Dormibacteraeota bacterium]|nr:hypothetical protein [Candidatus Dormibacteraeota bacterium]